MSNYTLCIFPRCKGKSVTRGLCARHYQMARRLIRVSDLTWEMLEEQGKCKKPNNITQGSKDRAWFNEALNQTKKTPSKLKFVMEPDDISDEIIEQSKQIIVDCTEEGEEVQFWNSGRTFTMHKEDK